MKQDKFDNSRSIGTPQGEIPKSKQQAGSTKGKYPVMLDDGKTVIFISDKKKETEILERYRSRGKYKKP